MVRKTAQLKKPGLDNANTGPSNRQASWEGDDFHYRALFEQSGDCVFIIGLDFKYIAVNWQAAQILGYAQSELVGMPVKNIMALDEFSASSTLIGENANLIERILLRKDGSSIPVDISTSLVYDEAGLPAYVQSIARDISERKKTEQILQSHNRILAAISESAAKLLRLDDMTARIHQVLNSLGQALQVTDCLVFERSAINDDSRVRILHAWQKDSNISLHFVNILEKALIDISSSTKGLFVENAKPDISHYFPCSYAIVPVNLMDYSWGFLAFLDFEKNNTWAPALRDAIQTSANLIGNALQRNHYEERIRESEARNRIIIDAIPDLVIRIDSSGKILDYTARREHPLFINDNLVQGKYLNEIWPKSTVRKILRGNRKRNFSVPHVLDEFRLPFSEKVYESRLNPISPREALIMIREITLQAELKQMKSDFINRASHELRTPLTTAMMMVELIQGGGTQQEQDEYWQILNSELNRQKILIDRLLIAGRLENGMMHLDTAPTDLLPILKDSLIAVKPIAHKKKIHLKLTSLDELPKVLGDKSGLQQVFINLINNATKFSPEGSQVEISVSQNGSEIQVAVVDQGMGIPTQDIPHLFERFFRARNVTLAEIPGSGVGLYIVRSILEGIGGRITLTDTGKTGTTFTVTVLCAA